MDINWKLRIKNPYTLTSFATAIVALIYQMLGIFEIVPSVSESDVVNVIGIAISVLTSFGILIDPTTKGMSDSSRAMGYNEPN